MITNIFASPFLKLKISLLKFTELIENKIVFIKLLNLEQTGVVHIVTILRRNTFT